MRMGYKYDLCVFACMRIKNTKAAIFAAYRARTNVTALAIALYGRIVS